MRVRFFREAAVIIASAALAGCGEEIGDVEVSTWGEEYIEKEIPATAFEDGWSIHYTKFLVVIGDFRVADEAGAVGAQMEGSTLFNHVSPGVKPVASFTGLEAKAWQHVSYTINPASAATAVDASATEADKALMVGGGYTVYVEGQATRDTVKKTFAWGFSAPTLLDRCEGDKDGKKTEGILVTNGGTDAVELTIHGDHLFYDDLQAGNAKLRFDAIAAADTGNDGEVTMEELALVQLSTLPVDTYGTGSAEDVNNLSQFIAALSRTVGHFRGEGECFVADP
jgi:hypothetical protein